jgi:23S rRNA (guanine2445-N2)-methyltransferase / 23S rRNA (guanine2069-N7)-methyltransferase
MSTDSTETPYLMTAARGLGPILAEELRGLGAHDAREQGDAVAFGGDIDTAYRCLIGSRVASRMLYPLTSFDLPDADACYTAARTIDWPEIFGDAASFMVEVTGHSRSVSHTQFAALRVKDAVVDQLREARGHRPDVDTRAPDIRLLLQLQGAKARLSVDIGDGPLHRRGYRIDTGEAPLRENLAAAILLRAGWPARAAAGEAFLDPFCGSGTLVIEAALMATHSAPGLLRNSQLPGAWAGHDEKAWERALQQAREACVDWQGPPLLGSDTDAGVLRAARANARRAAVSDITRFEQADALSRQAPADAGLLVANLPYGERIASSNELIRLYSLLGTQLKAHFGGWHAALLVGEDSESQRLGLRASAKRSFHNGALACHLLQFDLHATQEAAPVAAPDLANRLAKNQRHLGRWARRRGVSCYRLYDADLPEHPLLIDRFEAEGGTQHLHVQEFAAPKTVEPARAEARLRGALAAIVETTGVGPDHLYFKQRRAQKAGQQYARQSEAESGFWVREHGVRLWVDPERYLDPGLFLDHRPMRLRLQEECKGLRMLNLFSYTAAASVHAARGGAAQTVSVDSSNTYQAWAETNFTGNGFRVERSDARSRRLPGAHALLRGDCLRWLDNAVDDPRLRFERIFCDPPTFSNSKRDEESFDVQRDHVALIRAAVALLAPQGVLYFSCNRRRFKLDEASLEDLSVREITASTLDEDFRRKPPHRCWSISGTVTA